jgi:hypothetical protein
MDVTYSITFRSRNPIPGVQEKTVEEETAAAAWALVVQLEASDERAVVRDESGREIKREELRTLAKGQAN